ncbi:MAG: hypothetical protein M0Z28_23145 [Rhodospirillales bacterium]|nr:hypothetical protein [Rhodospirillales bacterium]
MPWNELADLADRAVDASGAALLAVMGFLTEWAAGDNCWAGEALRDTAERAHDMAERVAAALEDRGVRSGSGA